MKRHTGAGPSYHALSLTALMQCILQELLLQFCLLGRRVSIEGCTSNIPSSYQDPPGQAVWRPDHRWFLDTRLVETPVESGAGTSDPATSCRLRPSLPILVGASSCSVPAANLVGRKRRKRRRTKNTTDLKRFFNSNGGGDQSVYSQ